MRDIIISIQQDITQGLLTFQQIAQKYQVPVSWVNEAWDMLCEQEAEAERLFDQGFHDEAYEPDYNDNWYDEQYELNDY